MVNDEARKGGSEKTMKRSNEKTMGRGKEENEENKENEEEKAEDGIKKKTLGIFIMYAWSIAQEINNQTDWLLQGAKHNLLARGIMANAHSIQNMLDSDCSKSTCLSNMETKADSTGVSGWVCINRDKWKAPD